MFRGLSTVLRFARKLIELEEAMNDLAEMHSALDLKHRKLAGRVYATEKPREELLPAPDASPVCALWALAQRQGPGSNASKCECLYCEAQRAERARMKGELLPHSQPERIAMMKRGLAQ